MIISLILIQFAWLCQKLPEEIERPGILWHKKEKKRHALAEFGIWKQMGMENRTSRNPELQKSELSAV